MINDFNFLDFEDFDLLEEVELSEDINEGIIQENMVLVDNKSGVLSLHTTPDPGRNLGEDAGYFKCVDNISFRAARHIARIKFTEPVYIEDHTDPTGKDDYTLSSKEKKIMINLLKSNLNNKQLSKIPESLQEIITTGWQYLIYNYNSDCGFSDEIMLQHLDLNEPRKNLPRNLIRLTIPMPDYSRL